MNKAQLRQHYRNIRQTIPVEQRYHAAQAAADIFAQQPAFKYSKHIACYMAFNAEFNTLPLIHKIWQANKSCYLPVLVHEKQLRFALYNEGDNLQPNRFGILEPLADARWIEIGDLDIVITPLIAFDRQGNRLGTGGGYYDKTFANAAGKPLIGIGYAAQEAQSLAPDPWDLLLTAVITENEFIETIEC